MTPKEKHSDATSCLNWLRGFFECHGSLYGSREVPIDTLLSVIVFPYGERWRVRVAWKHDDTVHVHVSECPTGIVTLDKPYASWRDAVHDISNAIRPEYAAS